MAADTYVVADLDQVVDFGALADDGVADSATIDGCAGADFNIVLDDDTPDLRDLQMSSGTHQEAEAVLTDLAARMDGDAIADQRVADDASGADRTFAPDPHVGADHGGGPDDGAAADLGARPNHRARFDRGPALKPRGRVHMGASDLTRLDERGRPQRVGKQFARHGNEG